MKRVHPTALFPVLVLIRTFPVLAERLVSHLEEHRGRRLADVKQDGCNIRHVPLPWTPLWRFIDEIASRLTHVASISPTRGALM